MPRPDTSVERRRELAPALARTFADLGYRRATTSALAKCCDVQENILYRLWPDKRAMFIAALDFVYQLSEQTWLQLVADANGETSTAQLILQYESTHQGEFGLYRIIFAGLSETDDPEIVAALQNVYGRFQSFVHDQVLSHQGEDSPASNPNPELAAWAILGLSTVANIGRELDLLSDDIRQRLMLEIGNLLLGAKSTS
jgi:AcrR family transcriptional regulator